MAYLDWISLIVLCGLAGYVAGDIVGYFVWRRGHLARWLSAKANRKMRARLNDLSRRAMLEEISKWKSELTDWNTGRPVSKSAETRTRH